MFEEQPGKTYFNVIEQVNNLFIKKPFLCTLVLSLLVSAAIFAISFDISEGESRVDISQNDEKSVDAKPDIVVDLSGAVKRPGVYTLSSNSRLSDLLGLGGGFVSEISASWVSKNLNLSQILSDGDKVYIPFDWDVDEVGDSVAADSTKALSLGIVNRSSQAGAISNSMQNMGVKIVGPTQTFESSQSSSSSDSSASDKINVNTATSGDLDKLPGIGPAYAGKIIENRPYTSFMEFKEKSALSASLAESLKDLISF